MTKAFHIHTGNLAVGRIDSPYGKLGENTRNLSPQLTGLEGYRVRVTAQNGETRSFIVGRSMSAEPNHIERDSFDSITGRHTSRDLADLNPDVP